MRELVHVSLFTGFAMKDLAAQAAGFTMRYACEIEEYPRKVIAKHFPNVPIGGDIRGVTVDDIRLAGVQRVDLLTGGYPCQPFALIGKRKGKDDPRHLWPHMYRHVLGLRPSWVVAENVEGHVSLGLDDVLDDLEAADYETWTFVIPARAIGAPHRRNRVFVVAHAKSRERNGSRNTRSGWTGHTDSGTPDNGGRGTVEPGLGGDADGLAAGLLSHRWPAGRGQAQLAHEPPRLTTEKNGRTVRLRGLGNGVVRQQVYPIFKVIADYERVQG